MEIISTSPDKRFQVRADVWEARNSLWVYSPSIWDVELGFRLFSFEDEDWSVDTSIWISATTVRLSLRKFPGNHRPENLTVEIDCMTLKATILPSKNATLEDLEAALDRALTWV